MPGNPKTLRPQRPITEEIEDLKSKKTLLEGDRKAYYESSSWTIKKNKEKISSIRKDNKDLRKKLSDRLAADDHVINKAFENKPVERAAMSNKSGPQAITTMDYKVCDTKKKLNALRHVTMSKQKRLSELKMQYEQMEKDASDAVATEAGDSEDAQRLRNLENKLDKAQLKCNEADRIRKTYEVIKVNMLKDQENYENTLCDMEQEIIRLRGELKTLRSTNNDAQISKESAQTELHKLEEEVYAERKQREIELQKMKKEAEEKKLQHERIEKRIAQRGSLTQDDLTGQDKQVISGEEQQQKITTYEEAFKRIKEATGVSDVQEVVIRFEHQGDTTQRLEELKRDSEKQIQRLKEEKDRLTQEFEVMKYSGEAKLSSGQRMLEEMEDHLSEEDRRKDQAAYRLDKSSQLLVKVKSGVEHLADKLQHLKASKGQVPTAKLSPSSDEYVLDLLSVSEEKLLRLLEDLDGKDLEETMNQMEEEEFHASIETRLPQYNTRIKLPQAHKENVYDDDDESGDDDGDVMTRAALKRQSQQLVDSRTKRKATRKKKKGK
ncbi:outer dynein arm-docking complex subunit 3-like isoform X2 [Tubulanus polymorphus]|uniref:outer dynein arm-docking complex subunit 3-like isoform X2 n=1 Tax=Tubulanus polymorphus TaxID=672921 RepID=UPI003DA33CDA